MFDRYKDDIKWEKEWLKAHESIIIKQFNNIQSI